MTTRDLFKAKATIFVLKPSSMSRTVLRTPSLQQDSTSHLLALRDHDQTYETTQIGASDSGLRAHLYVHMHMHVQVYAKVHARNHHSELQTDKRLNQCRGTARRSVSTETFS